MGSLKGLQGTLRLEYRGALSIASYQIIFFGHHVMRTHVVINTSVSLITMTEASNTNF